MANNFLIKQLKSNEVIPEELFNNFEKTVKASKKYMDFIKKNEIKFGLFFENKMLGFATGKQYSTEKYLRLYAIYVKPEFKGKNLGRKLLYSFLGLAKKKGMNGVKLMNMEKPLISLISKEQIHWLKKSALLNYKESKDKEGLITGRITIVKQKRKPL